MVDITHKNTSLRTAIAAATVVVSDQKTIEAIVHKEIPKGDVFEMSKTAGLFAVKRTSDMIPDCHPLPVEYTAIRHTIDGLNVHIEVEVKTIYRTGVEVEAMHGASVVALTMYDMLKPVDKGVEIANIRLVKKKGGKSSFKNNFRKDYKAGIIVCSDSISNGIKEDKAGLTIKDKLEGIEVEVAHYQVIPDEIDIIQQEVNELYDQHFDIVIVTGGTGLSKRDVTPEALYPLLDREIPGMAEAIRSYGQERTPYAMLSRSIAGLKGETLILGIPGSTNGAKESVDAIFPFALHLFGIVKGARQN